MQMRIDVVSNMEANTPVPVYFANLDHMEAYCEGNDLVIDEIRGVKLKDAALIRHEGTRVGYGLVWVNAKTPQREVRKGWCITLPTRTISNRRNSRLSTLTT
ncbi:hypothetical protein L905_11830 [Agrobacterium sp. TS43]|nr:hypothetical protein K538_09795 [Agrobacterium tumefaciens GW4]KVK46704.1 hypothetical protein L904_22790 [Agrobacterium sp. LY4]KVK46849.1 hypothetical protein L903_22920 [Agrobacterium sp. JL28]KVK61173.1 hypothetical protein L906_22045 [Agrobacterium sp. TS45]KVK66303.1 hypothetical protein L907_22005 [Agrobacterium sp. C13]KVK70227.1 hypothetical protein L905_11830 [Agrobacterium sp. TS43]